MALINNSQDDVFKRETKNLGVQVKLAGAFSGFHYSNGKTMLLRLYDVRSDAQAEDCR